MQEFLEGYRQLSKLDKLEIRLLLYIMILRRKLKLYFGKLI